MKRLRPALVLGQAMAVRAGPGVINLASLMVLGNVTAVSTYGIFSTVVATGGMISNMVFGLVILATVSQYAGHAYRENENVYVSTLVILSCALAIPVVTIGLAAAIWIELALPALALVLTLSAHAILQELVRARQKLVIYGLSDITQALVFLVTTYVMFDRQTTAGAVVFAFSASYIPAVLISLAGLRGIRPVAASVVVAKDIVGVGRWLVLTNLSENVLYTGARYLVLGAFGPHALGIISFSVDLSQRTVAFLVNAASFVYVPKAFHVRERDGDRAFWRTLREGGIVAGITAVAAIVVVVGLLLGPAAAHYAPATFDAVIFVIVALAGVANRLKKLLVEPMAIVRGVASRLPIANVLGAAGGLAVMALSIPFQSLSVLAGGYLCGYLAIVALSIRFVVGVPSTPPAMLDR